MKNIISFVVIFLILTGCISKNKKTNNENNFTVQFEFKTQKTPFETCNNSSVINSPIIFQDTLNTFSIEIDSSWIYKYSDPDQGTMVHTFHQPNDSNLKLIIVVDEELYTKTDANNYFNLIFPQENLKTIKFASDSCKWHTHYSKNQFDNGDIKHVSQSVFYYHHKISKRFFTIVLGESKITKEQSTSNFACLFQASIKSFTPLN